MFPDTLHSGLLNLISAAVAPVVLITATAILLSGFTAKYSGLSGQLRTLTAEYRADGTSDERRRSIKTQLRLFHKRITAMWAASALLVFALFSFLTTVLAVILATRAARMGFLGAASLVMGLFFVLLAILFEMYEIRLAQTTLAGELSDIFASEE